VPKGQAHGLTSLLVKFSTLSRNTSVQINMAMSPHTRQIPPLVPRPRKGRKTLSEIATKAFTNFYDSGAEMVEGAILLPFDPPILWDEDTSLWDFVLEQRRSGREPQQEMIALKEEISTNTGPRSPMMREFWAALSFGMTIISC
jgi:hypothetical protein